ncbi:MAG: hypothetical protein KC910_00995 [Candidatus Eremiobacteraeota bacterium]|nr:hypothetical protein [Candidatus Eremiobacteraeota bacterium]
MRIANPDQLAEAQRVKQRTLAMATAVAQVNDQNGLDFDSSPQRVAVSRQGSSGQGGGSVVVPDGRGQDEVVLTATAQLGPDGKPTKADVSSLFYWHGDENWNNGVNRYTLEETTRKDGFLGLLGKPRPVRVYTQEHTGNYRDDKFKLTVTEDVASGELSLKKRGWRPDFRQFDVGQGLAGGALGLFASALPMAGAPLPVLLGVGVLCGAGLGAAVSFENQGRAALGGAATLTGLLLAGYYGGPAGVLGSAAVMFGLGGLGVFSGGY